MKPRTTTRWTLSVARLARRPAVPRYSAAGRLPLWMGGVGVLICGETARDARGEPRVALTAVDGPVSGTAETDPWADANLVAVAHVACRGVIGGVDEAPRSTLGARRPRERKDHLCSEFVQLG